MPSNQKSPKRKISACTKSSELKFFISKTHLKCCMVVRKRALSKWAMIKRDVSTYLKISSRNLLHHCFFLALTSRVLRYYPSTHFSMCVCSCEWGIGHFLKLKELETPHSFNPFNPTIEFYFQWIIKFTKTFLNSFFHIHNPLQWHRHQEWGNV